MAEFPAMPFWFDAYWRDTQHLTYEEHGIYLAIISLLWHAPARRIPNDRKWLKRRFKEHTPKALAIITEFCQCDGNWISQGKVTREFQYLAEKSHKATVSANLRWHNKKDTCDGNANAVLPTPTPTKERKKERLSNGGAGRQGGRRGKPRQAIQSKRLERVWFDKGTPEFNAYAADYYEKHGVSVTLEHEDEIGVAGAYGGAWFNLMGEK